MDISSLSDNDLVCYVRDKDKQAFAYIIERFESRLSRYVMYIVNDLEGSKDIVQEVFIKGYINLASFDINSKFSSWIYRIAHNEAINYINKNKKFVNFDTTNLLNELVSTFKKPEEVIFDEELILNFKEVINKIEKKYSEVLILYILEQKSYEEISYILRTPTSTVGTRIKRGKILLQSLMKEKGYGSN